MIRLKIRTNASYQLQKFKIHHKSRRITFLSFIMIISDIGYEKRHVPNKLTQLFVKIVFLVPYLGNLLCILNEAGAVTC